MRRTAVYDLQALLSPRIGMAWDRLLDLLNLRRGDENDYNYDVANNACQLFETQLNEQQLINELDKLLLVWY